LQRCIGIASITRSGAGARIGHVWQNLGATILADQDYRKVGACQSVESTDNVGPRYRISIRSDLPVGAGAAGFV